MNRQNRLTLPWLTALCFIFATTSLTAQEAGGLGPGTLIGELNFALNNPTNAGPTQNWRNQVDLTFANWRNSGSQNLPVIAAAVALVRSGTATAYPADFESWWNQFLNCQNGTGCAVANPGNLIYFKGQELFSYTYDWSVVASVSAVNWWARAHGRVALQDAARLYLRKTWSLYALAAGNAPITSYQDNTMTGTSIQDGNCSSCTHTCLGSQGRITFDGPFLALAAARSSGSFFCVDQKRVLFAQAIDWPMTIPNPSWEQSELRSLRTTLMAKWASTTNPPTLENVYGFSPADRQLIRDHIVNGTQAAVLLGVINTGTTRFIWPYRFFAWPGGVRASVMARNPACAKCGGAIYATKFSSADRRAQFLYPWLSGQPSGHRRGLAQILNTTSGPPALPNRIEAVNCDPAVDSCPPPVHGSHTVWFDLSTDVPLFQILLGPDGPGVMIP